MQINSCLDARCAAAMVVVVDPYDHDTAGELAYEAHDFANSVGRHDFQNGTHEMPILFRGQKLLENAWSQGHAGAAELEEMASCSGCHNDQGTPCFIHG